MNFLQFAVWGAYLTSMGNYLGSIGLGSEIGLFMAKSKFFTDIVPVEIHRRFGHASASPRRARPET